MKSGPNQAFFNVFQAAPFSVAQLGGLWLPEALGEAVEAKVISCAPVRLPGLSWPVRAPQAALEGTARLRWPKPCEAWPAWTS